MVLYSHTAHILPILNISHWLNKHSHKYSKVLNYNPIYTKILDFEISDFTKEKESDLEQFVMMKLGMANADLRRFKHKGNVMSFKSALIKKSSGGQALPYDEHYGQVKDKLEITVF